MIPSVFISSTIADLHYVREVARKVVKDFAMNPVMSDFGEIAYMGGNTAESSCYLSVKDCKLMVLIIGRRYGSPSKTNPEVSVTEHEYLESQKSNPFLITLVEKDVISFKEVYEQNKKAKVDFPGMDQSEKTFAFIDRVANADRDNGIFKFSNAEEVDRILRLQFAGLFGRLLDEDRRPEKESIKDLISEVQGIRAVLSAVDAKNRQAVDDIAKGARFLLDSRNAPFAKILTKIATIEDIIPCVRKAHDFDGFISHLHCKINVVPQILNNGRDISLRQYIQYESFDDPDRVFSTPYDRITRPLEIGWISPKEFTLNERAHNFCNARFAELKDRVCGAMSEAL